MRTRVSIVSVVVLDTIPTFRPSLKAPQWVAHPPAIADIQLPNLTYNVVLVSSLLTEGGGVRGLSALLILRELVEDIAVSEGLSVPPKPCEYFELIGGTSTEGLIAIMLGSLGMVKAVPMSVNRV